jgi:plastocyanin
MGGPLEGAGSVLLRNGRVLVAGGQRFSTLPNYGTVYDPTANTWTDTGPYDIGRASDGLVIDPTSGQPILVGGTPLGGGGLASVELYDAQTNTWWDDGELSRGLEGATVTMLASGRIIAAGGSQGTSPVGFTEKSPQIAAVSITNTGFNPTSKALTAPASEVRWSDTAGSHSVVDSKKLGPANTSGNPTPLFSSGTLVAGQSYSYTFAAAGTYSYKSAVGSSFSGTIKVPDIAFLTSEPGPDGIYVAFASSRMPGYRFDVAYRFMPSGGSFGAWTAWAPPGAAQWVDPHGVLRGIASGTYQFRSRLVDVGTAKSSGFSKPVPVVVP